MLSKGEAVDAVSNSDFKSTVLEVVLIISVVSNLYSLTSGSLSWISLIATRKYFENDDFFV